MVRIGRLDRRIELQRFTLTMDGDPTSGSWTTVHTVWAEKMDKGGAERFVSAAGDCGGNCGLPDPLPGGREPELAAEAWNRLVGHRGDGRGAGRKRETLLLVSRYDPGDSSG